MEPETKEYIRSLLNHIKMTFAENTALRAILSTHGDPETRRSWEIHLHKMMNDPDGMKEVDAKFGRRIRAGVGI